MSFQVTSIRKILATRNVPRRHQESIVNCLVGGDTLDDATFDLPDIGGILDECLQALGMAAPVAERNRAVDGQTTIRRTLRRHNLPARLQQSIVDYMTVEDTTLDEEAFDLPGIADILIECLQALAQDFRERVSPPALFLV